jgi:hypothetical protein
VSTLRSVPWPPRPEVRLALRDALPQAGRPLRILAEDVTGLERRLDLVAADGAGRAVLVLVAGSASESLELVAAGLAERAWLEPRLGDWRQLAPELDLRPGLGIELLLVAPEFPPAARAAAQAADPHGIALASARFAARGPSGRPEILLESLGDAEPPVAETHGRLRSVFRTGLRENDLAGSAAG